MEFEASGRSKNFERGGAEDNLSAPSSFIANAHNDL